MFHAVTYGTVAIIITTAICGAADAAIEIRNARIIDCTRSTIKVSRKFGLVFCPDFSQVMQLGGSKNVKINFAVRMN